MNSYPPKGALHPIVRFLTFSSVFLFLVWMATSCDKDIVPQDTRVHSSTLSVEEAKQFFASKIPLRPTSLRDDSEESESKPIEPAWEKAVSYYDEKKKQSVVEVGLFDGRFSRMLFNPDNTSVDTAAFFQTKQNNRLIIVKDSAGTVDYAIMKIDGAYSTPSATIDSISYQKAGEQFKGFITYVDITDSVKARYYMENGRYAKIDSTSKKDDMQGLLQERWQLICQTVYEIVPCNCGPDHTNAAECTCGTGNNENHHGPYVAVYVYCYDVTNIGLNDLPSGYNGVPTYNPTPGAGPGWGTGGGGTPGNPNSGLPPWPYQS